MLNNDSARAYYYSIVPKGYLGLPSGKGMILNFRKFANPCYFKKTVT